MSEETTATTSEATDDRGLLEALDDAFPSMEGSSLYTTEAEATAARANSPVKAEANKVAAETEPTESKESTKQDDSPSKEPSLDDLDPSKDIADELIGKEEPDEDPLSDLEFEADTSKWTPEQAFAFKTLKGQLKELKPKIAELEQGIVERDSRLKELEAVASGQEVETLKQQIEEYERRLVVTDLESSQVYQDQIAQPIERLADEVDAFAERHNLNARDIIDAIHLPTAREQDERLSEILVGVGDRERSKVYDVIEAMEAVMERRATIMENAEAAAAEAKALEAELERNTLAERAAERRKAASQVATKVGEKLPFLAEIEGLDLNKMAEEISSIDPTALDAVKHSYHALSAKLLPHLAKRLISSEKERESVLEQLATYKSSSPSAGGPSGGAVGSSSDGDDEDMLSALNRRLGAVV